MEDSVDPWLTVTFPEDEVTEEAKQDDDFW